MFGIPGWAWGLGGVVLAAVGCDRPAGPRAISDPERAFISANCPAMAARDFATYTACENQVRAVKAIEEAAGSQAPAAIAAAPQLPSAPPDFTKMPEYAFDKANADSFCRDSWTKRGELNANMFNYCMGQERDGYANMTRTLKKFGANGWMTTLFPAVWDAWTKQGITQYRMVGYSLGQEADSFLDFLYERKRPSYDASKMSGCASQWETSDRRWTQTVFCYKN